MCIVANGLSCPAVSCLPFAHCRQCSVHCVPAGTTAPRASSSLRLRGGWASSSSPCASWFVASCAAVPSSITRNWRLAVRVLSLSRDWLHCRRARTWIWTAGRRTTSFKSQRCVGLEPARAIRSGLQPACGLTSSWHAFVISLSQAVTSGLYYAPSLPELAALGKRCAAAATVSTKGGAGAAAAGCSAGSAGSRT